MFDGTNQRKICYFTYPFFSSTISVPSHARPKRLCIFPHLCWVAIREISLLILISVRQQKEGIVGGTIQLMLAMRKGHQPPSLTIMRKSITTSIDQDKSALKSFGFASSKTSTVNKFYIGQKQMNAMTEICFCNSRSLG